MCLRKIKEKKKNGLMSNLHVFTSRVAFPSRNNLEAESSVISCLMNFFSYHEYHVTNERRKGNVNLLLHFFDVRLNFQCALAFLLLRCIVLVMTLNANIKVHVTCS